MPNSLKSAAPSAQDKTQNQKDMDVIDKFVVL